MNTILSFLADWKIKLAILFIVLFGLWSYHRIQTKLEVNKAVSTAVAEIKEQTSKENFRLRENSLNAKIELQSKIDKIQKDKNNEITDLKSRVRTLSNSLSERSSTRQEPSGVPNNPGDAKSSPGATGLQLSRPDATMALWFAGDASELQSELKACYKQYDEAKSILDRFKRDNASRTD